MADYYWKGASGGTGTHSNVAGNWVTTSGGSTAHTSVPGAGDNLFFDGTAVKQCEFKGTSITINNITVESTYSLNTIQVDSFTFYITGIATFNKYGIMASEGSAVIAFTGVNSAGTASTIYDKLPFLVFGSQEPTMSGIFLDEINRVNFTVAVDLLHMDNQDMILLNGIYPNVSFLNSQPVTAPGKTFSPTADPEAYGNIQYSEVDMLNFECAIPIKPHSKPTFADYNKSYRIRGTLTLTDPTFFWGNTTLKLRPTAVGQYFPANGEHTTYGGSGNTFAAKYNRLIIDANPDSNTYYFKIRDGLKLFCNKLEIRSNARLYGGTQSIGTHSVGAEIHCVSSPVVHGDWNFSQISRGIYRNTGTIPLLSHLYGGTGLHTLGNANEVLAVNAQGDAIVWSATAGGGGLDAIDINDADSNFTWGTGDLSDIDTLKLVAGANITFASDNAANKKAIRITATDTDTVYTHPTGDGNLHVPATSTSNNGKFLTAGGTAGSLSWTAPTYTTSLAWTAITSKPSTFAPIIGTTSTTAMAGNTAVDNVSKANLLTVLAGLDENDTLNIGDAGDDTNVVIRGNLQVDGVTTTVNSTIVDIDDSIIKLHAGHTGAVVDVDAGLEIERGDGANKFFFWDEGNDRWSVGSETMVAGTFIGALTGNADTATSATTATKATNIAGGTIGVIPYQSAANTTALLAGNDTTTKKFLTQTGDGSDPAAPAWGTIAAADVPALAASKITSGTFDVARIPTLNQNTTGSAASATQVTVTDNESTDEANLIAFVAGAASSTGLQDLEMDGDLTYNPSSGTLTIGNQISINDGTDLATLAPTFVQVYNTNGSSNATVKMWAETWGGKVGTTSGDDFFIVSANSSRIKFDGAMRSTFYGNTAADPIIRLATGDTTVSDTDDLGVIEWVAESEADGTDGDARLVAASVSAVAEADFDDTANTAALVFKTATSEAATEKMRITNDGKVGIGTNSPVYLLDVAGTGRFTGTVRIENTLPELKLIDTDATNDPTARIINNNGNLSIRSDSENVGTGGHIDFTTSGSEKMRLTDAGKVGMGTVDPDDALEIKANNAILNLNTTDDSNNQGVSWVKHSTNDGSGNTAADQVHKWATGITKNNGGNLTVNDWAVFEGPSSNSPKLVVKAGGNVGIGTDNPVSRLDLSTGALSFANANTQLKLSGGSNVDFQLGHWGNAHILIDTDGNDGSRYFSVRHGNATAGSATELFKVHENGATTVTGTLDVSGGITGATKEFVIDHPTKPNMKLHHGSLEGPEHAVYVRGQHNASVITLPDYWEGLVDEDTITVQLTPIGEHQELFVKQIKNGKVRVASKKRNQMLKYFYFIQGERKDVEKLEVEECLE